MNILICGLLALFFTVLFYWRRFKWYHHAIAFIGAIIARLWLGVILDVIKPLWN